MPTEFEVAKQAVFLKAHCDALDVDVEFTRDAAWLRPREDGPHAASYQAGSLDAAFAYLAGLRRGREDAGKS